MSSFISRRLDEKTIRESQELRPPASERDEPEAAEASRLLKPIQKTPETRSVDAQPSGGRVAELRKKLRPKLLAFPEEADFWQRRDPEKEQLLLSRLNTVLKKSGIALSASEIKQLQSGILDDLLGFGVIQPLIENRECSEIMVNGARQIYAEFNGQLTLSAYTFDDDEHVQWTAQRIVRPLQRKLDRAHPMVDARLPDGSRVHVVMPPASVGGTTITIRKFPEKPLTINDLIRFGSFTQEVSDFLEACVSARLNIVVSGGTGSGKTTLLNVLSSFIPAEERIITIEDAAELQLTQPHVVTLETAPPLPGAHNNEGQLTIRELVRGSLRMRPDRIVVGECRSGEALDMLQAMNTGHDGSLTTIHSNSPRDCIARLETLVMLAGLDLPVMVIRRQIASAIDLIVQQARLRDGSRRIVQITELQGMEGDQVTLQDLFVYRTPDQRGAGSAHNGGGKLEPTGFRPRFMDRLEESGFKLSGSIFGAGQRRF